jgi:glycosyltransferase involved in cell wall biosynthesis
VKIAPSDLAAEYTFGKKAVIRGLVHPLHNAIDLDIYRFSQEARESIRQEFHLEDKLIVGHIGRFNHQKNHMFLLEIFKELSMLQDNAVLMLVGKGELEQQIRAKAVALGIADKIIFTGVRSDVPRLLSAMDVFVFPSFYEGMPNTVIEAQAIGLPCIIADTITKEANITSLVQYLPLSLPPAVWAKKAMDASSNCRKDTRQEFINHKYDIQSAAQAFIHLCFGEIDLE